jgi:hypothetical protein
MKVCLYHLIFFCAFAGAYAQESDSLNLSDVVLEYEQADQDNKASEDGQNDGENEYVEDASSGEGVEHALVSPADLNTTRNYQSEQVDIQKFDEAKWKEIVGDVTFEEDEEEEQKREVASGPNFSLPPWGGAALKIVSYVIIVAIVVFLLYYVVKNISFGSKINRMSVQANDVDQRVDNIAEIDIEGLLEQARSAGNFKLAVRFYYLSILKRLNDSGMIVWKRDKTNRDYLYELFSRNYYFEEIKRLTHSYEEVWYGEHTLTRESFQLLTTDFESVHEKIKSTPSS